MIIKLIKKLVRDRDLIFTWTRYNIESDYLDTKLGVVWLVLQPLLMTVTYSLVFSLIMDRSLRGGVPFLNFFLSGMILWLSFNGATMSSTTVVAGASNLMAQIQFPRYVVVFVLFFEKLADFVVSFIILLLLNLIYGYYPTVIYLYLPLVLFVFFLFELALMFILATLGLFIRDIPQVVSLILRLLFYFSGVVFPADILPTKAVAVLVYNPLFFLLESFRNVIFYAEIPNMLALLAWLLVSLLMLWVGVKVFERKSGVFADYK